MRSTRGRNTRHYAIAPRWLILITATTVLAKAEVNTNHRAIAPALTKQPLRLRWFGPDDCADGQPAIRRIEELIAGPLESSMSDSLDVFVVVDRVEKDLRLRLSIADRTQIRDRELLATACRELIEASALIVALAINPALLGGSGSTNDPPTPSPRLSPPSNDLPLRSEGLAVAVELPLNHSATEAGDGEVPRPRRSNSSEPATASFRRPHQEAFLTRGGDRSGSIWHLGLEGETRIGLLPGVALGEGLHGAFKSGRWVISLSATYLVATRIATNPRGGGADFQAMLVAPQVCWLGIESRISVGPCLSNPIGIVHGKAVSVDNSTPRVHGMQATDFGLAVHYDHRSAGFVSIGLDGSIPWRRTSYVLNGEPVYRPRTLGVRIGVQAGLTFE